MSALQLHIDWTLFFINVFFIFGLYYSASFTSEWIVTPTITDPKHGHWKYIRDESNFLGIVHFNLRKVVSEYWCRPIFGCVVCMASVWGTIFVVTFGVDYNFASWVVHVVAIAGINSLLKQWL